MKIPVGWIAEVEQRSNRDVQRDQILDRVINQRADSELVVEEIQIHDADDASLGALALQCWRRQDSHHRRRGLCESWRSCPSVLEASTRFPQLPGSGFAARASGK